MANWDFVGSTEANLGRKSRSCVRTRRSKFRTVGAALNQSAKLHAQDKDTEEARRRSGGGMTEGEYSLRENRNKARNDFYAARCLADQVQAYKGKRKGKGAGKGKGNGNKNVPKAYEAMTSNEQWWLEELWSGRLRRNKEEAAKLCSKVQAKDFYVFDYD